MYGKHKMFVEEYFRLNMNGTQAYKNVYGVTDDNSAAASASRLLRSVKISKYISDRLEERVMPANEVLARLSDHAHADIGDFLDIGSLGFVVDMDKAKDNNKTHLIKKVKQRVTTSVSKDGTETETQDMEVELHDAQSALTWLGKHHKLFTEKYEIDTNLHVEGLDALIQGIYGKNADDQG